ncbi:hypothetical protein IG631_15000 [Alternaria alternata]|nr:hypothetical protein IG631_15000 [Alternaria alternata]
MDATQPLRIPRQAPVPLATGSANTITIFVFLRAVPNPGWRILCHRHSELPMQAACCQEIEGLKPVGNIHHPPTIITRPPMLARRLFPLSAPKPIRRPKIPIPSRRISIMPREPIRDAVFAWGNLLAPLPCT